MKRIAVLVFVALLTAGPQSAHAVSDVQAVGEGDASFSSYSGTITTTCPGTLSIQFVITQGVMTLNEIGGPSAASIGPSSCGTGNANLASSLYPSQNVCMPVGSGGASVVPYTVTQAGSVYTITSKDTACGANLFETITLTLKTTTIVLAETMKDHGVVTYKYGGTLTRLV